MADVEKLILKLQSVGISTIFENKIRSEMVYISEKECYSCTLVPILHFMLKKNSFRKHGELCFSKIRPGQFINGYKFT